ncbi:MAG: peptidoglycan editing factor PgeF [Lachnospiraceae bacterium]|nr:peptidoglycan editing factor PgeF [Lachnospiraceae bacterium]
MESPVKIKYRTKSRTTTCIEKDGVVYLTYDIFAGYPIKAAVSTRLGGVSKGYLGSMNLSYTRGDDPACVRENHRLLAKAVGYDETRLALSDQIHETTILRIEETDIREGKGCDGAVVQKGVDGLMTNVAKLPLMTFYADCVPLLFYDPGRHVIAMAHSGWKGTLAGIGPIALSRMQKEYDCIREDVLCAIGPSICQSCYEVDQTVRDAFFEKWPQAAGQWFIPSNNPEHYLLDLASACRDTLMGAGAQKEHIAMPDLCTCCNPDFLFSHRASGGKRGNLSVVMELL